MKKFLAVFDGLRFCESTLQFSITLAKQGNAHLVGVFLDDFTRRSYGLPELAKMEAATIERQIRELDARDDEDRLDSVRQFRKTCRDEGISFSVHRDSGIALQDLLLESVYADLLIISKAETLKRMPEPVPTKFIQDLLSDVQCPVAVVPETYRRFNKLLLLYDGSPSSVHAVRTFSYLFESLKHLETEVLTVNQQEENVSLPNARLIREFIGQHFPEAETVMLKGSPEEKIGDYLQREKKYPVVVCGAYQRSRFSRAFRPSMADYLMQHTGLPLFIAHNKS